MTRGPLEEPDGEVRSSMATLRLTAAGVTDRRRAAPEKLAFSALRTNDSRLTSVSIVPHHQRTVETPAKN